MIIYLSNYLKILKKIFSVPVFFEKQKKNKCSLAVESSSSKNKAQK